MSSFRTPWASINRSERQITSERCMKAYEDLENDLRKMSDEEIIKNLDNQVLTFVTKEEYCYRTDTIYDYVFIFSGYEVVYIETNDCCEFEGGCYAYSDDGHWWNYGYDEVTCYFSEKMCERLFNIGIKWLAKQPFKTYAQYLKWCNDDR